MKHTIIWSTLLTLVMICAAPAFGQNLCSKPGDREMKIYVRNATDKPFTVNYVDESCKESASDQTVEPGRQFVGETTEGAAFRVREAGTNRLLQEIAADPQKSGTTVGIIKNTDPRQSFIQTLNQMRRGRNLPPMELNDSLSQGCQWFADLMAKFDKGGHDAVEIGGSSYASMQDAGMRSKKYGYAGDGGTEATASGNWTDLSALGGEAMVGWSSSDTHYRPFLSMDGQLFKHVGFGFAKSSKTGFYYTCAVFGNPPEENDRKQAEADGSAAANKEPIKTDVPDGLKFTAAKMFWMENGEEKYLTTFDKSRLDELQALFAFENPSSRPFNVEVRSYLNGKIFSSESMKDLKGSGEMSVRVAGEPGKTGQVAAGKYRFEVLLNGEVVVSAEAVVK